MRAGDLGIENLRRHYVPTLEAWAQRFDANWERIHALNPVRFDERFRRIWRTYLLGCAEMFRIRNGVTHLFQFTFAKGNRTPTTLPDEPQLSLPAGAATVLARRCR